MSASGSPLGRGEILAPFDDDEEGSLQPLRRPLAPASDVRSRATWIAVSGVAATIVAAGALLRAASSPGLGSGRASTADSAVGAAVSLNLNGSVGLYGDACTDTPDWTNGWVGCAWSKVGKDPTLCKVAPGASWPTTLGYTCKWYEIKGICKPGNSVDKSYAMGPGLNSPEKNCCACRGYAPSPQCNRDTGGGCKWTKYCNGWRGPTECKDGKCICREGYCADSIGTCSHSARAQRNEQKAAASRGVDIGGGAGAPPQCHDDTDDSCFMGRGCEGWRGAIECKGISCKCKPGYCVDSHGTCYKHLGNIQAKVVEVNQAKPTFPGPQIRTALAVSGGGCRAAGAAFGAYRALRDLGLLDKIDMISSVSGGSWASAILMFAKMDLGTLLGPATDPRRLTLDELDKDPAPLGAVCMHKTTEKALKLKLKGVPFGLLWVATVSDSFLAPFDLHRFDSFMALNEEQVRDIKSRNPQYADMLFYTPQPGRAKNIAMGSAIEAPNSFKASEKNVVYLQAGADYTGSPFYPNDAPVRYESDDISGAPLTNVLMGGGLVESFAFGGSAPAKRVEQMGGDRVNLHSPSRPFSLSRAIGMSSAAFGAAMSNLPGIGAHVNPQVDMWPVSSMQHPRPQEAMRFMVGDGQNIEDTGVVAMLQRKAEKVAALVDGAEPFEDSVNYCDAPGYTPTGKEITGQFANFFGYAMSTPLGVEAFPQHNQVFESSEYLPILCEFNKLRAAGRSLTVRRSLKVLRNDWWGIEGGWTVDIVFFLLNKAPAFEQALPAETQEAIREGPSGGLNGFPGFKTTFMNPPDLTAYTARQINLLAALVEWSVRENADMWRSLLQG